MYFSFRRIVLMLLVCHFSRPAPLRDTVCLQTTGNFQHACAFEVFPVDTLDDFGFLRNNHQVLVFVLGITEKPVAVDLDFTLLVAVLQTQLCVLALSLAFSIPSARGGSG